jgi:hypothetical protein
MDGCHFACGVGNCGADDGALGFPVLCRWTDSGIISIVPSTSKYWSAWGWPVKMLAAKADA